MNRKEATVSADAPRAIVTTPAAKAATEDIKWLLSNAGLDGDYGFKVRTKTVKDKFVTTIYHVRLEKAREALAAYAQNHGAVFGIVFDGYADWLTVVQAAPRKENHGN